MKYILIWLIRMYQKIPGKWHEYCKYVPTCSDYAIGALEEYGFFKGSLMSIRRILRCNRFSKGGYDPIPLKGGKNRGKY